MERDCQFKGNVPEIFYPSPNSPSGLCRMGQLGTAKTSPRFSQNFEFECLRDFCLGTVQAKFVLVKASLGSESHGPWDSKSRDLCPETQNLMGSQSHWPSLSSTYQPYYLTNIVLINIQI